MFAVSPGNLLPLSGIQGLSFLLHFKVHRGGCSGLTLFSWMFLFVVCIILFNAYYWLSFHFILRQFLNFRVLSHLVTKPQPSSPGAIWVRRPWWALCAWHSLALPAQQSHKTDTSHGQRVLWPSKWPFVRRVEEREERKHPECAHDDEIHSSFPNMRWWCI